MKTINTFFTIIKILLAFISFVIVMTILFCGYIFAAVLDNAIQKLSRKKLVIYLINWFHADSKKYIPAGWHIPTKKDMKKVKKYLTTNKIQS